MTAALRIALIADHMPGHYRQSEAVVEAIAETRPASCTRLTAFKRSPLRKRELRRFLLDRNLHGALPLIVRGRWRGPFDLIVASSPRVLTAAQLLKQRTGAPLVFCGPLDAIDNPANFDCVLIPYPPMAGRPNHALGPVPVSRFRPADGRKPFAGLRSRRIGVLIGGIAVGAGYDFPNYYCDVLFKRLTDIAAVEPGINWVVVTSRRTPPAAYPAIEAFCAAASCDFVDYRSAGPGSIARAQACDGVLVTEDSNTMITEFVLNGIPTAVLRVPRARAETRQSYVDALKDEYALATLDPAALDAESLQRALTSARIETRDNYAEIRERIGRYIDGAVPATR